MNTPMLFHSVLESVDTETKKQLEKNKTYLTSFTQLGIQLSPEKEVFKSKLVIQYQDQESILYSDEFKPPTVGPLLESEDKKKPPTPLIIDNSERDLIEISEINPKDLDESKYLEYYKNGELKIKAYLKDGVLHGSYREYYDNGELKIKGHFKQGKRSGRWKKYDNKGKTIVSVKY
jgi:antitoxin component YwqK of YwqJK toxin-antitoxin module